MSDHEMAGRRRRWWVRCGVLGAVVLVGGVVVGALAWAERPDDVARSAPPGDRTMVESDSAPGCHAGPGITNAALRAARQSASLDEVGAAAFSADLFRWLGTSPTPDQADDLALTVEELLSPDADEELREMFADAVDQARRGQSVDDWWVSTEGGRYYVESSTDSHIVVSVSAWRVSPDEAKQAGTQTFTLTATDHGWGLQALSQTRSTQDLQTLGTTYSQGC